MTRIIDIEGIGTVFAKKLSAAGIKTVEALLKRGATPKGREEVAKETGLGHKEILEWVNRADLYRIKGVGSEYSDLLENAGVDTVVELSKRDAKNLTVKMAEANTKRKVVRRLPTEKQVAGWISQAKRLPRAVSY
jgi:predicted flap endonuclease-1-like 5' DNA nuclease